MSWTYCCPKCKALLNPHDTVMLVGACEGHRLLVGFHPEPGNYEIWLPPGAEVAQGQPWDFFCPVCQADLVSAEDSNLCALDYETEGQQRQLLFSRIAGEQATYVVGGGTVHERHGRDAQTYFEHAMAYRLF